MLVTTEDMYKATLFSLQKENIGTVYPDYWNALINVAYNEWIDMKADEVELNQKRIDDLEVLRVVTDGVYQYNGTTIQPISGTYTSPITEFELVPSGYPTYRRMLNAMFKIVYINNDCYDDNTVSDWLGGKIMRSDERSVSMRNPYRKPKDSRLYYEIINNVIRLETGTDSYGSQARIEYIRQPDSIYYNETNPADTGDPTTGSVNCELAEKQKREIVDLAARIYIERVKDERYQTLLNEFMLKVNNI